jgi:hypothetical protein
MLRVSQVSDTVDLVLRYIKQETVAPLRGAGRWLLFGCVASLAIVLSSFFVLLAVLRFLQSSSLPFSGGWSWVPYIVTILFALSLIGLSVSRINHSHLNKAETNG